MAPCGRSAPFGRPSKRGIRLNAAIDAAADLSMARVGIFGKGASWQGSEARTRRDATCSPISFKNKLVPSRGVSKTSILAKAQLAWQGWNCAWEGQKECQAQMSRAVRSVWVISLQHGTLFLPAYFSGCSTCFVK